MADGNNAVSAAGNSIQQNGPVRAFLSQNRWEIVAILACAAAASIIALGALAHLHPGALTINNAGPIAMMAGGSVLFVTVLIALAVKHLKKPDNRQHYRQHYESLNPSGQAPQGGGQAPQ